MKKIACLLLVFILSLSILASCTLAPSSGTLPSQESTEASPEPSRESETQSAEKNTQSTEEPTESFDSGIVDHPGHTIVPGTLPEDLYFGDRTVNIYLDKNYASEWIADAYTDEIINDSVYDRNSAVESRLGVKLNFILADHYTQMVQELRTDLLGAFRLYDIVVGDGSVLNSAVTENFFSNLYDFTYLNLENPWWDQDYVNQATVDGKLFTVSGDLNLSSLYNTCALYFNKDLADQWFAEQGGVDYLYELAVKGEWTMDAFIDLVKDVYRDDDGDARPGEGDFYGFGAWFGAPVVCDAFRAGMDLSFFQPNEEGNPQWAIDSDRTRAALDQLYRLTRGCDGVLFDERYGADVTKKEMIRGKFAEGSLIFCADTLGAAEYFRPLDRNLGLLPMPKLDREQENYGTARDQSASLAAIPADILNSDQADAAGATLELLCEQSYREAYPILRGEVLKYRYFGYDYLYNDKHLEDHEKIFDWIVDGCRQDFGDIYDSLLGVDAPGGLFRSYVKAGNNDAFVCGGETLDKKLEELIAWFENY